MAVVDGRYPRRKAHMHLKAFELPAVTLDEFPYDTFYAISLPGGLAEVYREGSTAVLGYVWNRDQWYCYDRNMQPAPNEFGIQRQYPHGDDAIAEVVRHEVKAGRLVLTRRVPIRVEDVDSAMHWADSAPHEDDGS
jgi:hypothetical protein